MDQDDGDRLTIELPGGGSLGFARFGDPDGVSCLAFHGTSSSRLMPGWMFAPELLTAAGVRMIGVDRPGYGLSTVPWAMGFSDWPRAAGRAWARSGEAAGYGMVDRADPCAAPGSAPRPKSPGGWRSTARYR